MATHSSILAQRIPQTEQPGGLQSMGSQSRTGLKQLNTQTHTQTHTHTHTHTHSLLTSSGKSVIAVTLTAGRQAISNNFQVVILPFDIQEGLGESPWAGHVWGWQPLYGGDLLKQEEWKPLQEESKPLQEESYRAALGLPRNDRGIWSTRQTTTSLI